MSYGFTAYSSSGFVQIGEDYKNYFLLQEGTINIPTADTTVKVTFPSAGGIPIVAIRTTQGAVALYSPEEGWGPPESEIYFRSYTEGACSFSYRVYKKIETASTGGVGLKVFNSAGAVVFDSSKPNPLTVLGVINYSTAAFTGYARNLSTPFSHSFGNRFIAFSYQQMIRGRVFASDQNLYAWAYPAFSAANNSITLQNALRYEYTSVFNRVEYEPISNAAIVILGD